MIITILFYIVGLFVTVLAFVFPDVQLWPEKVFTYFEYFIHNVMSLNVVVQVIPDIFEAIQFFLRVMLGFCIYLIIRKIFNYIRGAEGL